MQYLAEIQKQSKGFMGGFETKLKLLACQESDRSWKVVPGNECVSIEDTGNLGDGALVMVNLGSGNKIQGTLEPASTRIIGILQGFSRLLEKSKSQGEEIETWKESLTIQSEQLSARELEMETRLEQLERMEEEFNQFETQRQEISLAREEAEKLRLELESKKQTITQEWEKLQEEQQRLAKNLKEGKFLDESQAAEIQSLLDALSAEINSTGSVEEHLQLALQGIDRQQEFLTKHWQKLEQNQNTIEQDKNSLLQSQSTFETTQQELNLLVNSLGETKQELVKEQQLLKNKQSLITFVVEQQKFKSEIEDSLARAGIESLGVELGEKLDIQALEKMPLSELEDIVNNLEKDLKKVVQFVQDQEEELNWQSQAVEELEQKIQDANEFDRLALEHELSEEIEAKKMLDETLVGQRRSLKERHERLLQHSRILKRRQGVFDLEAELQTVDLQPIKDAIQLQQQHLSQEKEVLESEITQIQQNIQALEAEIAKKTTEEKTLREQITEQSHNLEKQKLAISETGVQLNFYHENLQSLQDALDQIKKNLDTICSSSNTNEEVGQSPIQVITEIDRKIKELVCSS